MQHLELDVGQLHRAAGDRHRALRRIDHEPVGLDRAVRLLALLGQERRPPQHRADAASELADRERLGDVVVGAQLEAEHLVDLVVARGQHDDRARRSSVRSRRHTSRPSRRGSITSSTTRSTGCSENRRSASSPSRACTTRVSLPLERIREQLLDRLLVVDEHDCGFAGHLLGIVCDPPRRPVRGSSRPLGSPTGGTAADRVCYNRRFGGCSRTQKARPARVAPTARVVAPLRPAARGVAARAAGRAPDAVPAGAPRCRPRPPLQFSGVAAANLTGRVRDRRARQHGRLLRRRQRRRAGGGRLGGHEPEAVRPQPAPDRVRDQPAVAVAARPDDRT